MKKSITLLMTMAILVISGILFSSCDKDGKKAKLIGKWKLVEICDGGDCRNCEADNSITTIKRFGIYVSDEPGGRKTKGRWKLDGDILTFRTQIVGGLTAPVKIEQLDDENLVYSLTGGSDRVVKYKKQH